MTLRPDSIEQLQKDLPKSKGVESFDLSAVAELKEHVPEDMTATVQAGMSLADFQAQLAKQNQCLPVDPPHPVSLSIGALLGSNANGPRRFGLGTIRDWLIGIAVVLPDGNLIRNGGKVVKNVAGFDLCKLFVGSRGTLGIIVEATFKLLPLPESEIFLARDCDSFDEADTLISSIWISGLQPHVLDLHAIDGQPSTLVIGFAGASTDVNVQVREAGQLGISAETNLKYDEAFRVNAHATESVVPAQVIDRLRPVNEFVARVGNGVIHHRGESATREASALEKRIKAAFDPNGILPAP